MEKKENIRPMKTIVGILLIASPLWLFFLPAIPVIGLQFILGYNWEEISEVIFHVSKYFYFVGDTTRQSFIDKFMFNTNLFLWIRVGYWFSILVFIALGVRQIWKPVLKIK